METSELHDLARANPVPTHDVTRRRCSLATSPFSVQRDAFPGRRDFNSRCPLIDTGVTGLTSRIKQGGKTSCCHEPMLNTAWSVISSLHASIRASYYIVEADADKPIASGYQPYQGIAPVRQNSRAHRLVTQPIIERGQRSTW